MQSPQLYVRKAYKCKPSWDMQSSYEKAHLEHAVIEDGCLPATLGVLLGVCKAPNVPPPSIALQVQQHQSLHTLWNAHGLPGAIQPFHLQGATAAGVMLGSCWGHAGVMLGSCWHI